MIIITNGDQICEESYLAGDIDSYVQLLHKYVFFPCLFLITQSVQQIRILILMYWQNERIETTNTCTIQTNTSNWISHPQMLRHVFNVTTDHKLLQNMYHL